MLKYQIPMQCQIAVGNLPYRISSAVVRHLLRQEPPLRRIVLMVQSEFARKLLATPGTEKFEAISALAAALCDKREVEMKGGNEGWAQVVLQHVAPELFRPAPRVDSQVIRLEPSQAVPS